MKVKELIEKLNKLNPERELKIAVFPDSTYAGVSYGELDGVGDEGSDDGPAYLFNNKVVEVFR